MATPHHRGPSYPFTRAPCQRPRKMMSLPIIILWVTSNCLTTGASARGIFEPRQAVPPPPPAPATTTTTAAPIEPEPAQQPPTPPSKDPSTGITFAPFAPVPTTDPPTAKPTPADPTASPTDLTTASPTSSPSSPPTVTDVPSMSPSEPPTMSPTVSKMPTDVPSASSVPSSNPSTAYPTVTPTEFPSASPVIPPTSAPSYNSTLQIKRDCNQVLEVKTSAKFEEPVETGIFSLLMQSYTLNFGAKIGPPFIETRCEVIEQDLAGTQDSALLVMKFSMEYKSRYGYEVSEYPTEFQTYINSNLDKVALDMEERFLPVTGAKEVIVFNTNQPTESPVRANGSTPSMSPSIRPVEPTTLPSLVPTASDPPSSRPSKAPHPEGNEPDKTDFIIGLVAGLGSAAIIVMLLIWYMRRKSKRKERESAANEIGGDQYSVEEGVEVGAMGMIASSHHDSLHDEESANAYGGSTAQDVMRIPQGPGAGGTLMTETTVPDSMFTITSNPSMVSAGGGSFSSNPEDSYEGLPVSGLQDEFDNYKNQDLEHMRSGVEGSVTGAEGMMSLAMTRALMEEEEEEEMNLNWGGAEDPESIEANGLCETNDWLRKNDNSTLDERNVFFQEILNKMVVTVRKGMVSPADGTRIIHCCAAILGLQLEKEQPNNVLLVHGMRKTNDLSLGRTYLVETFKVFGDIEGAAIAPNNRGFGFVRFVSPKSVQRAMEKFRVSEIEVQDVSVMIKSLKPDPQV